MLGMKTVASLRREHGLTQTELARKSGVKQSHISEHESSKGSYALSEASKRSIARAFGLTASEIEWEAAVMVYLVVGRTGSGDYEPKEWIVGAHRSLELAQDHAARANAWLYACGLHTSNVVPADWATRDATICPFDPDFSTDSMGTDYDVRTVAYVRGADTILIAPGTTPAVDITEDAEPHVAGAAIT
jgi:transcriptional regulator with XRE-family HTH domain